MSRQPTASGNEPEGRQTATPVSSTLERGRLLSEFERLLKQRGCPACRYVAEAERSFFAWFEIETSTTTEVQARLRAGLGICAAHARRLVDDVGEGPIMTRVMRQALNGAREKLGGEPAGPCPACDAAAFACDRAQQIILNALRTPTNAQLYREHRGMCLPHVLKAVATAEPSTLTAICATLLSSLREADNPSLEMLAGADPDAPRRARWRDALPEEPTGNSTIGTLCARLAIESCPVCLSEGLMGRRYLGWLVERNREHDQSVARDPGELCPAHLHDLTLTDLEAGREMTKSKGASRVTQLSDLLHRFDESPPPTRRRRRAEVDLLEKRRGQLTLAPHCPACHACDAGERSQLELIATSLALKPMRERYECSHGLCFHHAMRLPEGQPRELAKRHLDARLALLAWEVEETARKYVWASRHETPAAEHDAWLRGLVQLDGRVFGGGPAPVSIANDLSERV